MEQGPRGRLTDKGSYMDNGEDYKGNQDGMEFTCWQHQIVVDL